MNQVKNIASSEDVIKIDDCDDEEDWLPSPVKISIDAQKREEDSIIKAIRYISNLVTEYCNMIICLNG